MSSGYYGNWMIGVLKNSKIATVTTLLFKGRIKVFWNKKNIFSLFVD
jgi:hypothetical protein